MKKGKSSPMKTIIVFSIGFFAGVYVYAHTTTHSSVTAPKITPVHSSREQHNDVTELPSSYTVTNKTISM